MVVDHQLQLVAADREFGGDTAYTPAAVVGSGARWGRAGHGSWTGGLPCPIHGKPEFVRWTWTMRARMADPVAALRDDLIATGRREVLRACPACRQLNLALET